MVLYQCPSCKTACEAEKENGKNAEENATEKAGGKATEKETREKATEKAGGKATEKETREKATEKAGGKATEKEAREKATEKAGENALSCPSCSARYAWNDDILQFVRDEKTEAWDAYWKRIPVYDNILDVLRTIMNLQLRRYLEKKIAPSSATLEPGGGSAYVSAMLAEKGHKAYAMDYASAPLRIAQQQLKSKAVLVQGDLFNIPFADESFDLTFNNSTMEHFKNPLDGMKEMARVTQKGGFVFVGVPFTYGPLSVYKLKKSSFKGAWDGTTYDRKGLQKLFQDAGLEVVGSRTFFFRCFIGVLGRKG